MGELEIGIEIEEIFLRPLRDLIEPFRVVDGKGRMIQTREELQLVKDRLDVFHCPRHVLGRGLDVKVVDTVVEVMCLCADRRLFFCQ